MTKQELIEKISAFGNDDNVISLIEEITDNLIIENADNEKANAEIERLKKENDDLRNKYIARFKDTETSKKEERDVRDEVRDESEKKYIDVKEF